jgi:hypothetical protein
VEGDVPALMTPLTEGEAGLRSGCLTCGPMPVALAMDTLVMVGFGQALVTRDDVVVWQEVAETNEDDCWTAQTAEYAALFDPNRDWRIVLYGALSDATYQRHGAGQWLLVKRGKGIYDDRDNHGQGDDNDDR